MENIRGRGFMDRSCCDRPRFPAAIRALDDREKRRERERDEERADGEHGKQRAREREEKSQSWPRPLPYVIGWTSGRSAVVCLP